MANHTWGNEFTAAGLWNVWHVDTVSGKQVFEFDEELQSMRMYDMLTMEEAETSIERLRTGYGVKRYVSVDSAEATSPALSDEALAKTAERCSETLDALQYLTSLYINHGRPDYARVTLDTENYRAKREEALRRLANRMANRAIKTGRKVVMEPMNPYERRILHSALQQNDAVTTHSEGEEPNRHVVITLKSKG